MIDFHVHLGNCQRHLYPRTISPSVHQLIERMDREGIELAVLLPLESPEAAVGFFLTEDAVRARDLYPERLIAFMSIDPRQPYCAEQMDVFVRHHGCRGFGELLNHLPFDHERNKVVYRKCEEHRLPLVFEINAEYCPDTPDLQGLEGCLQEFPGCLFVGHGPGFWAAISGNNDGRGGYPPGPIAPGGALDRLLPRYDNLYADISAGSGHNALTRDPAFTVGFVQRHWRKLLFATDYMGHNQPMPQVAWLRSHDLTDEQREAIAAGNARRLLGMA